MVRWLRVVVSPYLGEVRSPGSVLKWSESICFSATPAASHVVHLWPSFLYAFRGNMGAHVSLLILRGKEGEESGFCSPVLTLLHPAVLFPLEK